MPSKSKKQARLMRAVAHGWEPDRIEGPTRAVAKEFVAADKRRKKMDGYQYGGLTGPGMYRRPMLPGYQFGGSVNFRGIPGAMNRSDIRSRFPAYSGPMMTTGQGSLPPHLRNPGASGALRQYGRQFPVDAGGVPWRGRDPRQRIPGPRTGFPGPRGRLPGRGGAVPGPGQGRGMPRFGGLAQMADYFRQQQGQQGGGGRRGVFGSIYDRYGGGKGGPRRMVPPSPPRGYPGGGNPNLGGRNPMGRIARDRYGAGRGRTFLR